MFARPDRPLVVRCTFDRQNKKITFSSARNCSYEVLRRKVEQGFALSQSSYSISFEDDNGEICEISNEGQLTEAIEYFQSGSDDPPLSSAASILSGRSFGSKKITLRVNISVEFDGRLSDTSSLVSLEEYNNRNGSQGSFSFGAPSEIDDDSMTVSSRDVGGLRVPRMGSSGSSSGTPMAPISGRGSQLSGESSWDSISRQGSNLSPPARGSSRPTNSDTARGSNPSMEDLKAKAGYPSDPSAVFERLKLEEALLDEQPPVPDPAPSESRGAVWLREQNNRTLKAMLGAPSSAPSESIAESEEPLDGDLALERNNRGTWYYAYTASGVSRQGHEDYESIADASTGKPRPTSRQLNWLASQQITGPSPPEPPSFQRPSQRATQSEPAIPEDEIPPEFLHRLPLQNPPAEILTDCSECGMLLDGMRYVCATCGEKLPKVEMEKGKAKDPFSDSNGQHVHTYPPLHTFPPQSTSLARHLSMASSVTYVGSSTESSYGGDGSTHRARKPLPTLPHLKPTSQNLSVPGSPSSSSGSAGVASRNGYELCPQCMEICGVTHAIEVGAALGTSPTVSTSSHFSHEDAERALQWRRTAPKQKGQLRHAYIEKIWGHTGWEDVEQEEAQSLNCSACGVMTNTRKCYKCATCPRYYLCKACYSQVHDMHPSHAFLVVPHKKQQYSISEPDYYPDPMPNPNEEKSLVHPGVKCAHCMLDIVGARFHCAICDDVDICSNCESAGLPGNLDDDDGGHSSSHIMIKIPYPLERTELQTASKRAMHLWKGRDGPSVLSDSSKKKAASEFSSYARTVVANGSHRPSGDPSEDHHIPCSACNQPIFGVRFQCAHCTSSPISQSLCASCEERSYLIHDPYHVFIKIPRPVDFPLEEQGPILPRVYKQPAGSVPGMEGQHPLTYLRYLAHTNAVCDRCVQPIRGCWYRCAYCGMDLCDACEVNDTHNDAHVFIVFKAPVDMQGLKIIADLENIGSPPVIPYPIYRSSQ